jgi:molybdopterin synthase sulfur carrier subunit
MKLRVLYFASLRDAAGVAAADVETTCNDGAALYAELRARHGFAFPRERLRIAVDGSFSAWDAPLREGSEVAFIPPVSGG